MMMHALNAAKIKRLNLKKNQKIMESGFPANVQFYQQVSWNSSEGFERSSAKKNMQGWCKTRIMFKGLRGVSLTNSFISTVIFGLTCTFKQRHNPLPPPKNWIEFCCKQFMHI